MTVVTALQEKRERLQVQCPIPLPDTLRTPGMAGCLTAFTPMIHDARERVQDGAKRLAAKYQDVPFDGATIEDCLAANLIAPLLTMVNCVMVLELNVARLQGVLTGDTPHERFLSFVHRLCESEVSDQVLGEYSVLQDQVANRLEKWADSSLEFLEHLCQDWTSIRGSLVNAAPGAIVQIDTGAGDTHRNGRSVAIVSFASGERVVYKPRSLAVDEHFQQLLAWVNECGAQPRFRTLKSIDRGDHGWTQFVAPTPCGSTDEVCRFYERQGSYLAVLYALEASDFHRENLIATGEHPMLIDLEALFHPRLDDLTPDSISDITGMALGYSVLRVGLLPVPMWAEDGNSGLDLSGLGSAAGQLTPQPVPLWEEVDTDNMRVVRKRIAIGGADNRPSISGEEVNPVDYTPQIAFGFESTYRLLMKHRSELRAWLAHFCNDEVRVIARATQTYGTLLRESFHPDLLRNPADRLALFDRLQEAVEYRPCLARLIAAEREDLLRGDIPLFTTRPSSRDLWTSTGQRLENYFRQSGAALVQDRLQQLSEADLERQLWIIKASLATLSSRAEGPPVATRRRSSPVRTQAATSELIKAACAIGDRLSDLALANGDDVAWIGLVPDGERGWRLSPLGLDLYDGIPGVTLFLAQLGVISGERRYSELAKTAVATMRRHLKELRSHEVIGGFTGWGGIIYALSSLGVIWSDTSLVDDAEAVLELLPDLIARDQALDVISGSAGCALALRSLDVCRPSPAVIDLARVCGEHLLRNSRHVNNGLGWSCNSNTDTPLTGFAHGSAGFGLALVVIAELTGERRFQEAAVKAFDYERSLFSPEHRNWPDLRSQSSGGFVTAWCHGAPGIALSRLRALSQLADEASRADIDAALATTAAQASIGNHTLCHGDLGNADILLGASEVLREPRWRLHADHIVATALAAAQESGWICGNPLGVESPGLMTGIAGIGYALLRFADPVRVPSILLLGAPAQP